MLWSAELRVACMTVLLAGVSAASFPAVAADPPRKKSDAIDVPIPEGQDARGLKIPIYGERGKLTMTLQIKRAEKIDKARMLMEGAEVETFDEEGKRDLRINLPKSIINLETRVVTSDDPVSIEREDFTLTGDSMEFSMKNRSGKLTGKIRMLIYDRNRISPDESATN